MGNSCCIMMNACRADGTTSFERVFIAQQPWSPAESIRGVAELHAGEADFTVEDVRPNVELALREHPRLSQVISKWGLWTTVDVDLAHHITYLPASELGGDAAPRQSIVEEPPGVLKAMTEMPAFKAEGRPLWQVIVTPRKLIIDIHHGYVDGVGLAVIASTIIEGKTMAEVNATMCKLAASKKIKVASSCMGWFRVVGQICTSLPRYMNAPISGLMWPEPKSAVFIKGGCKMKTSRLVHLGPYSVADLKAAAKQHKATLNGVLLDTLHSGISDFCNAKGEPAPTQCAVPVNFKRPNPKDVNSMKANNSFATLLVPLKRRGAFSVDFGEAYGAHISTAMLSTLPLPMIQWMYVRASRLISFIFSNVDGNWAGGHFRSSRDGARRAVSVYAYGAPPAEVSLFVVANSHGPDLHIGVTACQYIEDVAGLTDALHSALSKIADEGRAIKKPYYL